MTRKVKTYSVDEVAEQLDATPEAIRAAAARLRIERFRGEWHVTDDEIAAIREELGLASVLDDADEDEDESDDEDEESDDDEDEESDDDEDEDEDCEEEDD